MNTTIKNTDYVILATKANAPKQQLDILGKLIAKRFKIEGCKVITDKPTAEDCRGKIIVGGYLPSYLGLAAKSCIEINTQEFFGVPARFIKDMTEEETESLLKYPKAYSFKSLELPKAAEQSM